MADLGHKVRIVDQQMLVIHGSNASIDCEHSNSEGPMKVGPKSIPQGNEIPVKIYVEEYLVFVISSEGTHSSNILSMEFYPRPS